MCCFADMAFFTASCSSQSNACSFDWPITAVPSISTTTRGGLWCRTMHTGEGLAHWYWYSKINLEKASLEEAIFFWHKRSALQSVAVRRSTGNDVSGRFHCYFLFLFLLRHLFLDAYASQGPTLSLTDSLTESLTKMETGSYFRHSVIQRFGDLRI